MKAWPGQTPTQKKLCARLAAADAFLLDARKAFAIACAACASRRIDADEVVLSALATVDRARAEIRVLFDANVGGGVEGVFRIDGEEDE
ncbi:MAG: hypothetical protein WC100_17045 [Sterolibacterium sp.]